MKKVYKFYWDWGRMGEVHGMFVAESKEIEDAIGKEVYFGEILGKYSEVYGTLKKTDLRMVSDDKDFVTLFQDNNVSSGYNPLDYIDEDDI